MNSILKCILLLGSIGLSSTCMETLGTLNCFSFLVLGIISVLRTHVPNNASLVSEQVNSLFSQQTVLYFMFYSCVSENIEINKCHFRLRTMMLIWSCHLWTNNVNRLGLGQCFQSIWVTNEKNVLQREAIFINKSNSALCFIYTRLHNFS